MQVAVVSTIVKRNDLFSIICIFSFFCQPRMVDVLGNITLSPIILPALELTNINGLHASMHFVCHVYFWYGKVNRSRQNRDILPKPGTF